MQARWKAGGQETLRAPKTPARLRPMAKPDSSGLVPGIHFHRRDGPEGDARNKSGHDGKGAFGHEE